MGMASSPKKKSQRKQNSSCLPFTGRLHSRKSATARLRPVPPWKTRGGLGTKRGFGESALLATHLRG